MTSHFTRSVCLTALLAVLGTQALAFDPGAGAPNAATMQAAPYATYAPLPEGVVPARYYQYSAAVPTVARPASMNTAPMPSNNVATIVPPAPLVAASPVAAPMTTTVSTPALVAITPAPAPTYNAPTYNAPAYNAPAIAQPYAQIEPAAGSNVRSNANSYLRRPTSNQTANLRPVINTDRYSVGIEGYYDEYEEDSVDLKDQGVFGSITASYEHDFNAQWYGRAEGRGSYGNADYESISGEIDNIPQWELEARLLAGYNLLHGSAKTSFYSGIGTRYFVDELKGESTSLGALGYDRRILQVYLPIGFTYSFNAYGLQFTPNLEYDRLIYGHVNSRLQTIPGFYELNNIQTSGNGFRGELMMRALDGRGAGWEFGPFFRYWDIADSNDDTNPSGTWLEPENTRLQVGASVKYLF
jgi:hypothetical protein